MDKILRRESPRRRLASRGAMKATFEDLSTLSTFARKVCHDGAVSRVCCHTRSFDRRRRRRRSDSLCFAPLPDELKNSWPAEWEKEFQARAERVLKAICTKHKAAGHELSLLWSN
ncbi:MAG: hypothetical protein U0941_27670 [Planctomycetaceae bacterium]